MEDDAALLKKYVDDGSEEAFAELVRRHFGLVYHAALRQVGGDRHRAEDVAQLVFSDLARKAAALARRPLLVGWLYTSTRYAVAHSVRAEQRRQMREQAVADMSESLHVPEPEADWERLRPLIDDALQSLGERDRSAVLLRFFEGRSFAEVGDALAATEDAARVRVNRALEKVRSVLERRGLSSSSAALATALAGQAAAATPPGLAAQVTSTAFASSAALGASVGLGLFSLMATSKVMFGVTAALALLSSGVAIYLAGESRRDRAALADALRQQSVWRAEVQTLEQRLRVADESARAASEDEAKLLGALESAAALRADPVAQIAKKITKEDVDARYKRAQELAKAGRAEEALREFLWCYDEGMPGVSSYSGLRMGRLVDQIANLGQTYPPALAALRERRDQARALVLAGGEDSDPAIQFASLNEALKESALTLGLYDQLPPDDARRKHLGMTVWEPLAAARRYQDAAKAMPYNTMRVMLEGSMGANARLKDANPVKLEKRRAHLASLAALNVEILAGAGDLTNARSLLARMLEYDNSPDTRATLQTQLARAGHPELLEQNK